LVAIWNGINPSQQRLLVDILKFLRALAGEQGGDIASLRADCLAGLNNILLRDTAHTEQHAADVAQFIIILSDLSTHGIREMLSMTQRRAFVFQDDNGQDTELESHGTTSTMTAVSGYTPTTASNTRTAESESTASMQHDGTEHGLE
jgi:hypothetical protein